MTFRTGNILRKIFKESSEWHPLSDAELVHLKQVMLEISDDIVSLCEKHNLKYCMAYGTALGSVRHKGYIPWDDDIDFFMPRDDYEKFMRIAEKELGDLYVVRSVSKGDKVNFPTLHIRKKRTFYVNYGDLIITNNEPDEDRGIYVDIAPLDNASDISVLRNIKGYLSLMCLFAASCIQVKDMVSYTRNHDILMGDDDLKALRLKERLGMLFSMIPRHKWMKLYDNIVKSGHNKDSRYIISYCGMKKIEKGTYERKEIYPFIKGEFEGRIWNLPKNTDVYLTIEYGDYMTIPQKEMQKIHPVVSLKFDTLQK